MLLLIDFIRYLFIDIELSIGLCLIAVSVILFHKAMVAHYLLTESYNHLSDKAAQRKTYKPLCIQTLRGIIVHSGMYIIAEIHWLYTNKSSDIGATADLTWSIIELLGKFIFLKMVVISNVTIKQNTTKRKPRTTCNDCGESDICPVRQRCLANEKQTITQKGE